MAIGKGIVGVAIALLFIVPAAMAVDTTTSVGQSVAIDLDDVDPDLAAFAGHATYLVTWFDGSTLYERDVTAGERTIYAVADGDPSPVGQTLTATGVTFDFTDPNGVAWSVTESTYGSGDYVYSVDIGTTQNDVSMGQDYNFVVIVDTDNLGGTSGEAIDVGIDLYIA